MNGWRDCQITIPTGETVIVTDGFRFAIASFKDGAWYDYSGTLLSFDAKFWHHMVSFVPPLVR